jgi:hypothetical protein
MKKKFGKRASIVIKIPIIVTNKRRNICLLSFSFNINANIVKLALIEIIQNLNEPLFVTIAIQLYLLSLTYGMYVRIPPMSHKCKPILSLSLFNGNPKVKRWELQE